MPSDAQTSNGEPTLRGAFDHDSSWELPELAPVLIIISVALLVLGSGVATAMLFSGQSGFGSGIGWALITSALRWIDPSTSTMLLLAAALIWWQYGYWSTRNSDLPDEVIDVHIARLRTIAKWNLATFVVTIASVVLLIFSSIFQNTNSGAQLAQWAGSVETICTAVGTLLLSFLGVVALLRILVASRPVPDEDL